MVYMLLSYLNVIHTADRYNGRLHVFYIYYVSGDM